jgi:hypothetical protein
MPKYLVVPDGLVEGYERYGREREAPSTKNADNGVRRTEKSATLDPKQPRLGSPYKHKTQTDSKKSTPLLEDRCCNCTKYSTCTTKCCECRMANKPCVSCVCLYQCNNQCVEIKTEGRFGEREITYGDTVISWPCAQTRSVTCRNRPMATKDGGNKPTPHHAASKSPRYPTIGGKKGSEPDPDPGSKRY